MTIILPVPPGPNDPPVVGDGAPTFVAADDAAAQAYASGHPGIIVISSATGHSYINGTGTIGGAVYRFGGGGSGTSIIEGSVASFGDLPDPNGSTSSGTVYYVSGSGFYILTPDPGGGGTSSWQQFNTGGGSIDFQQNSVLNYNALPDPADVGGQLYYAEAEDTYYISSNGEWIVLTGGPNSSVGQVVFYDTLSELLADGTQSAKTLGIARDYDGLEPMYSSLVWFDYLGDGNWKDATALASDALIPRYIATSMNDVDRTFTPTSLPDNGAVARVLITNIAELASAADPLLFIMGNPDLSDYALTSGYLVEVVNPDGNVTGNDLNIIAQPGDTILVNGEVVPNDPDIGVPFYPTHSSALIRQTTPGTWDVVMLSDAPAAAGGGLQRDMQVFSASGTGSWVAPAGAVTDPNATVTAIVLGPGGGGGSGRLRDPGVIGGGGGGGAPGAISMLRFRLDEIASTQRTVIPAGGAGGAPPVAGAAANGNAGSAPGAVTIFGGTGAFGSDELLWAGVGQGGGGGTAAAGAAGTLTNGIVLGDEGTVLASPNNGTAGAGGAGAAGAAGGFATIPSWGATGGGGGGGVSAANAQFAGGTGGGPSYNAKTGPTSGLQQGVAAGGTAGGGNGAVGQDQFTGIVGQPGRGGGGGGSSNSGAVAGGNGGNGAPGCGGGGGGAGTTGGAATSGAGGNGGNGMIVVITEWAA